MGFIPLLLTSSHPHPPIRAACTTCVQAAPPFSGDFSVHKYLCWESPIDETELHGSPICDMIMGTKRILEGIRLIEKTNTVTFLVDEDRLACTVKSGSLRVLATPMMIAGMEQAACELLQQFLDEGQTSVGTAMQVEHVAATPCGMEVTAQAKIVSQDGRQVNFEVSAWDRDGEIGHGVHTRFIVDAERFQKKADRKLGEAK